MCVCVFVCVRVLCVVHLFVCVCGRAHATYCSFVRGEGQAWEMLIYFTTYTRGSIAVIYGDLALQISVNIELLTRVP